MVECNICYNDISYGVNCFAKCKIVICHNCFLNLLKLNDLSNIVVRSVGIHPLRTKINVLPNSLIITKNVWKKWLNFYKRN